jgi:hypothetical protein
VLRFAALLLPEEPEELRLRLLAAFDELDPLLRRDELDPPDDPPDELDPLEEAWVPLLEEACAERPRLEARLDLPRSLVADMVHLPDAGRNPRRSGGDRIAGLYRLGYPSVMVATRLEACTTRVTAWRKTPR